MNDSSLKVVIPMAGLGTRLRPHTWSKPKQLVSVAGKTVLDHVLDSLKSLPDPGNIELVSIVGYLGEQIEEHIRAKHPHLRASYVLQENPRGQSHAIKLAQEHLHGPMLVIFADTLIKSDLSFLTDETAGGVAWVKAVPDPRRFGVAELGQGGCVKRLIEKPQEMGNNLAVVGFYYFKEGQQLISAIDEQMARGLQINGEFFLADAINIMLERGLNMRVQQVDVWLDAGTPEALLEMNRYLLANSRDNSEEASKLSDVVVVPPVFVHPSAQVHGSIIGPNVSIGAGCVVEHSIIQDSILEDDAQARGVILENSLVGRRAVLSRRPAEVNAGDSTAVTF
ncbi:MAG: NTP transferase domain-containing protein [Anaerolineales bacterium]|nr:NTP transferase domain-containing protein [Anaerolineales bacterium]